MRTNCINCGAVIDNNLNKCPYCGTLYFDFTNIDLDEEKPVYIRIKKGNCIVSQKAIPVIESFENQYEPRYWHPEDGSSSRMVIDEIIKTSVSFYAVPAEDGTLYKVQKIEE